MPEHLRDDLARRESVLQTMIHRFGAQYKISLETFDAPCQGQGQDTPIGRFPLSGVTRDELKQET